MNAPAKLPRTAALFRSNRNQAVRIPKDMEFPDDLKNVVVRKVGKSVILTPKDALWDEFFAKLPIDDDFVAPDDLPPQDREFGFD